MNIPKAHIQSERLFRIYFKTSRFFHSIVSTEKDSSKTIFLCQWARLRMPANIEGRQASYGGRRSESHLLVSSYRIPWSELHDPSLGMGEGHMPHKKRSVLMKCLLENKHVLVAWIIMTEQQRGQSQSVHRTTEEESTDLRKPLRLPSRLYIFCWKLVF